MLSDRREYHKRMSVAEWFARGREEILARPRSSPARSAAVSGQASDQASASI
jgi:hypothetical protein